MLRPISYLTRLAKFSICWQPLVVAMNLKGLTAEEKTSLSCHVDVTITLEHTELDGVHRPSARKTRDRPISYMTRLTKLSICLHSLVGDRSLQGLDCAQL